MQKYRFEELQKEDILLFSSLLYENGIDYQAAVSILANTNDMLEIPYALYLVSETLRYQETDAEQKEFLKNLDEICKKYYDTAGFSDQVL